MTDDGAGGGDDLYTPAQFREYQEGYGDRDSDVDNHTALVRDAKLSRYLSILATHYDPREAEKPAAMPGQSKDLRHVRDIVRIEATEAGRKAMDAGDMQTLKHLTGDQGQRADVSGIKAIDALRDQMTGPAPMFYVWAEPGARKTNFACLLAQLWKEQQATDAIVASNVRTLEETDAWAVGGGEDRDGWLANYGELKDWLTQDGDPMHNQQRPKLFIFDEASGSAGGSGSDGHNTKKKMGPLAYKIRKYGGSLIVIGHDGKDVHPLIRELGTAIHKEGLKEATFYQDVRNPPRPPTDHERHRDPRDRLAVRRQRSRRPGSYPVRRRRGGRRVRRRHRGRRDVDHRQRARARTPLRTGNWRKDAVGRLYVLSAVEAVQGGRKVRRCGATGGESNRMTQVRHAALHVAPPWRTG